MADELVDIIIANDDDERIIVPVKFDINKSLKDNLFLFREKFNEESIKYCRCQSMLLDIKHLIEERDDGIINIYETLEEIKKIVESIKEN